MAAASETKVFTIGLDSLEAGAINETTGLMPTSGLARHGYVYRDTLDMTTEDPTTEEYYEEETDLPVASMPEAGKTTLTFEILRPSVADLVFWAGGSGDGNTWSAPTTYVDKKLALKIVSKQGYVISIPKAQIVANTTGGGAKSTPMRLKVTATVLVPTDANGSNHSPIYYSAECAAPHINPAGWVEGNTLTVTMECSTPGAKIYYTTGSTPADPTSSSTEYTGPLTISASTNYKAIAIRSGLADSAITSKSYTKPA